MKFKNIEDILQWREDTNEQYFDLSFGDVVTRPNCFGPQCQVIQAVRLC